MYKKTPCCFIALTCCSSWRLAVRSVTRILLPQSRKFLSNSKSKRIARDLVFYRTCHSHPHFHWSYLSALGVGTRSQFSTGTSARKVSSTFCVMITHCVQLNYINFTGCCSYFEEKTWHAWTVCMAVVVLPTSCTITNFSHTPSLAPTMFTLIFQHRGFPIRDLGHLKRDILQIHDGSWMCRRNHYGAPDKQKRLTRPMFIYLVHLAERCVSKYVL